MKSLWSNLFVLVLVLLSVLLFEGGFETTPPAPDEAARNQGVTYGVSRVIDGDTVELYKGGVTQTVRLLGIDAPETAYAPTGAECFNEESTAHARQLLEGAQVVVTTDPSQDQYDAYDRLLGYITLPDGTDFGAQMLEGGFATEYTFKGRTYQRQSVYRQIRVTAEAEGRGMWNCE